MNIQPISREGPAMIAIETTAPRPAEADHVLGEGERGGLPWWTYFNAELLEIEKDRLFRLCWQLVGPGNDTPDPADYLTFARVGERPRALRGKNGAVRCFHNVCRHRGS